MQQSTLRPEFERSRFDFPTRYEAKPQIPVYDSELVNRVSIPNPYRPAPNGGRATTGETISVICRATGIESQVTLGRDDRHPLQHGGWIQTTSTCLVCKRKLSARVYIEGDTIPRMTLIHKECVEETKAQRLIKRHQVALTKQTREALAAIEVDKSVWKRVRKNAARKHPAKKQEGIATKRIAPFYQRLHRANAEMARMAYAFERELVQQDIKQRTNEAKGAARTAELAAVLESRGVPLD